MSIADSFLEELAPDFVSLTGSFIGSKNHCESDEVFGQTISTLAEIQIFAEIFGQELFHCQMPTFAVALSDQEQYPGFMAPGSLKNGNGSTGSIVFFNHLYLRTKHPLASFEELAKFMASIWAMDSCGVGPDSFGDPDSPYAQTLGDIFEFIGVDARDLQLKSAREASVTFKVIPGGKFDRAVESLLQQDITIEWPERAYYAGLGLLCRFDDKTANPSPAQENRH